MILMGKRSNDWVIITGLNKYRSDGSKLTCTFDVGLNITIVCFKYWE